MNSLLLLGFAAGAAALTWALVALLIRHAPRIGLVDRPNERSLHTRVTPRGGGIGFVVAIVLGVAVFVAAERPQVASFKKQVASAALSPRQDGELSAVASASSTGRVAGGGPVRSLALPSTGGDHERAATDETLASLPTGNAGLTLPSAFSLQPSALLLVLGAALFIAAISLRDDFRSLGAGLRFACHFAAAETAIWVLGPFVAFELPFVGSVPLGLVLGTGVTLLWIVGLTNVYNFMDGIDGIAGIQGVVAGLGWAVAGLVLEAPMTALLGALLVGGCGGFLVHNWSPAKIFMGDVGSAFLGFLFAVVPLVAGREAPEVAARWPLFAALAVGPFLGDGILTFARRARKGEKVWEAHRSHLYQRLVQTGWKHAKVSDLYGVWGLGAVLLAWLWLSAAPGAAAGVLLLPVGTLVGMYAFVTRREKATGTSNK